MKIIFLGTNGWYDTDTGNTPCILVDSQNYYLILDVGNGAYKLDKYLKQDKPIYLFITHFHLDHIIGLHFIFKFNLKGLKLYLPAGTDKFLNAFFTLTKPIKNWPFNVEIKELKEGEYQIPFRVSCKKLFHQATNFGYRFELDNKIIVYTGDTGICENDLLLAKNADLLIHECSFLEDQSNNDWGHADPEAVAKLAEKASVKKVLLTHFSAGVFTSLAKRQEAETKAQKIFRNSFAAKDGLITVL